MSLFSTCYQGRLNSCITAGPLVALPRLRSFSVPGVYYPVISLPSPQVLCSPSLAGIETLPVLFSIPPPPLPNKHSFSLSPFYQASSLQCPGDLLSVPPCSEPCPLPPPPPFRVLCDCFLPSILIFTHLPWSPDQPFSSHQAAGLSFCLSSGVFCLSFTCFSLCFSRLQCTLCFSSSGCCFFLLHRHPSVHFFSSSQSPITWQTSLFQNVGKCQEKAAASPGLLWIQGSPFLLLVVCVFSLK